MAKHGDGSFPLRSLLFHFLQNQVSSGLWIGHVATPIDFQPILKQDILESDNLDHFYVAYNLPCGIRTPG
jgi:hypothetical protein